VPDRRVDPESRPSFRYRAGMELLAEGRLAEVYAYGSGRVVKLDRPEWSGVSEFESHVLQLLVEAGLPVARSHGTVSIDGRCGVVLDRVEGRALSEVLKEASPSVVARAAERFVSLQMSINATEISDLPECRPRLDGELSASGLPPDLTGELRQLLTRRDDGKLGVCHFDFHPDNVLVAGDDWVVIDWLTVASGPPLADLARTLLLLGSVTEPPGPEFMRQVRHIGLEQRGEDAAACDDWIRVLAGARLAEGFDDNYAAWLRDVAASDKRLFS
jgi:hypothetical protein